MSKETKINSSPAASKMAHPEADLAAAKPALDAVWQQLLAEEAAQEIAPLKKAGETAYTGRAISSREVNRGQSVPGPASANSVRQFSENGSLARRYAAPGQTVQAAGRPPRPLLQAGADRQKELWHYNYSTQDRFLLACLQRSVIVDLHLKNESIQSAYIKAYDNWSLLVETEADGSQALIFKSAIMAVLPRQPVLTAGDINSSPPLSQRPYYDKNSHGLRPS
ncbi:hypothetical protein HCH52_02730 [Oscillospiraceae bacterium HV4-5-C5C]|nr:hypothetical protein [Oscillospiraceae bacterium HV4-5-C5C]